MRRGAHDQDPSDVPRRDGLARCLIARIETSLEADLDDNASAIDRCTHPVEGHQIERDRFLAERRHS